MARDQSASENGAKHLSIAAQGDFVFPEEKECGCTPNLMIAGRKDKIAWEGYKSK